ncbi:MAG: hypothetical protein GX542_04775 [Rhodococcus sp.]|nr:hypothetical protein [Rhodococcus sp. (in: high G+C Gram-positive bacteria)]
MKHSQQRVWALIAVRRWEAEGDGVKRVFQRILKTLILGERSTIVDAHPGPGTAETAAEADLNSAKSYPQAP